MALAQVQILYERATVVHGCTKLKNSCACRETTQPRYFRQVASDKIGSRVGKLRLRRNRHALKYLCTGVLGANSKRAPGWG